MDDKFKDEQFYIIMDASITGISDLSITIRDSTGAIVSGPTTLTEMGTRKKYYTAVTLDTLGHYTITATCPTVAALNNRKDEVDIRLHSQLDVLGSGYTPATDSLVAIANRAATILEEQENAHHGFVGA